MQKKKMFHNLTVFFRLVLGICLVIAVIQNYITDGSINIFGYTITQFYSHIEFRIAPLLFVSLYVIPKVQKILSVSGKFYFSEALLSGLLALDAFTHITGIYSKSIGIFLFGEELWYDKAMHFFEGLILLVAFFPVMLRFTLMHKLKSPRSWAYNLILGFTSIFYVSWEIVEYILDKVIGESLLVTGWYDTNIDLALAYFGSFVGFLMIELYLKISKLKNLSIKRLENNF